MGRPEDNKALEDLAELVALVTQLEAEAPDVLTRNRFTPGQRSHFGDDIALKEVDGQGPPRYSDPTGENGTWWDEIRDQTGDAIRQIATTLSNTNAAVKHILDLSSTDVVKRAKRTIPDCLACGDPCVSGVRSGFDDKCRKRWDRLHRPPRSEFIAMVKREREEKASHLDETSIKTVSDVERSVG